MTEFKINDSMVLGAKLVCRNDKKPKKNQVVWEYGQIDKYQKPIEEYKVKEIYTEIPEYIDGKIPNKTQSINSYDVVLYLSKDLKPNSDFYAYDKLANWLIKTQNSIYAIGIVSIIIGILALIYLLTAVGHKRGTEEISGSFITKIPVDVYTWLTAVVGAIPIFSGIAVVNSDVMVNSELKSLMFNGCICVGVYLVCAFISLLWLIDMAVRIKMGKWWQNSLIYIAVRFVVKGAAVLIGNLPLIWKTVVLYGIISVLELMGIYISLWKSLWNISGAFMTLWFIEKVVLFFLIIMAAIAMKKLQIAGEKISEGDLLYQVDTSHMHMDFKKHGENLNQIGQGLNVAVEERMKSERMKTELITNVSHDIKTPLTSIINYSDLIGKEETENEKINEYAEVLNRQSVRLKRLIEDLVEASKASTGNIDVTLEPTDVGVILTQAVGEYEDKLLASNLTLFVDKPEVPVMILADGRRLWRVLDNILNNVCKYAMEGTRVYLNMKQDDNKDEVIITLKNISREPLDISPDELMERFVRGDKSRKTDGNGLGLSIAKSLTELQNGKMNLGIDGDLFKVMISFKTQGKSFKG